MFHDHLQVSRFSRLRSTLLLVYLLIVGGLGAASLHAEEVVYRCEDGSFTSEADAGCSPYGPQSATALPGAQSSAAMPERARPDTTTITAVLPPPVGKVSKVAPTICDLYDEWQALGRTTNGGNVFVQGRDVARWRALSRLFLTVGTPHCGRQPSVQAAQASR